jgi:hypothetical protein
MLLTKQITLSPTRLKLTILYLMWNLDKTLLRNYVWSLLQIEVYCGTIIK